MKILYRPVSIYLSCDFPVWLLTIKPVWEFVKTVAMVLLYIEHIHKHANKLNVFPSRNCDCQNDMH